MITVLPGCQSSVDRIYQDGIKQVETGQFVMALSSFDKVIARDPESEIALKAAREAARVSFFETKNFKKAAEYYRILVFNSPDPEERLKSQRQVTAVYLDHMNNYHRAIIEINKLLPLVQDPSDRMKYKMDLARAYYYQNNFFQAEMEVDEFLRISKNPDQVFQMTLLKANIALARKDLVRAAQILREMIKNHPQKAQKENVGLTLAVAYEEMKDYRNAIALLQQIKAQHPMPDYIDLRIKKLQDRLKNQPGARGYRK